MAKVNKNFVVLFICINLLIVVLFYSYFIRDNGKDNVVQANERVASITEENTNPVYPMDPNVKEKLKQEILEELKSYLEQLVKQNKPGEPETPGNAAEQKTEQPEQTTGGETPK